MMWILKDRDNAYKFNSYFSALVAFNSSYSYVASSYTKSKFLLWSQNLSIHLHQIIKLQVASSKTKITIIYVQ